MGCCFDCRYFYPESDEPLKEEDWDEVLPGECRRHPPTVGDFITGADGDKERWFGNFPRVMAVDWCGEFLRREGPQEEPGGGRPVHYYRLVDNNRGENTPGTNRTERTGA